MFYTRSAANLIPIHRGPQRTFHIVAIMYSPGDVVVLREVTVMDNDAASMSGLENGARAHWGLLIHGRRSDCTIK